MRERKNERAKPTTKEPREMTRTEGSKVKESDSNKDEKKTTTTTTMTKNE